MQQEIPQQEQYVNPQQMQQPIMLCPIQYVYESPMLVPQHQEQPIQQNQTVVFNVQNPPPWIQNRSQPQNQVIYVQQAPNNYQPYIHPNMMQNHIYQPQFNYVQQPMLTQDHRIMQISNLTHYNTVQNQTQHVEQIKNEESSEKMPLLTQMLNEKAIANNEKQTNFNNVGNNIFNAGGTVHNNTNIGITNKGTIINSIKTNNINNLNMILPVTQNQQVQTDISANNKSKQPQIITINPMQHHQYLPVQKQDMTFNIVRPGMSYMQSEVPQHIRSKIPNSISVKTVFRPILPRPIRPYEVMQNPQNFYYNPNFVNATTETRKSPPSSHFFLKPNVLDHINHKQIETNQPLNTSFKTNVSQVNNRIKKPTNDASTITSEKDALAKTHNNVILDRSNEQNIDYVNKTEEKLIRNTVFTQARGLIQNDKEIQNVIPKRTIHDRLEEDKIIDNTIDSANNKRIKVEVNKHTILCNNDLSVNPTTNSGQTSCHSQRGLENLPISNNNVENKKLVTTESIKPINVKAENPKIVKDDVTETVDTNIPDILPVAKENDAIKDTNSKEDKCTKNYSILDTKMLKNSKNKSSDVKVLTHVLDGYIIQESNVAFAIQKPASEKETQRDKADSHNQENDSQDIKDSPKSDKLNVLRHIDDILPHLPLRYLNNKIKEAEMEFAVASKDDPFVNMKKSTIQSWTVEQLTAYLAKYDWNETADKLRDEEIDGESILLVNKDQLLAIGISAAHADIISKFVSSR